MGERSYVPQGSASRIDEDFQGILSTLINFDDNFSPRLFQTFFFQNFIEFINSGLFAAEINGRLQLSDRPLLLMIDDIDSLLTF